MTHPSNGAPSQRPLPTWQQTPRAVPPPQLGSPTPPRAPATGPLPKPTTTPVPPPPRTPVPTQPASGRRTLTPRRRPLLLGLGAVLLLGAAAGAGWAAHPTTTAPSPLRLVTGTVQADLLSTDRTSRLVGTTLAAGPRSTRPPAALSVEPSRCAVAAGPATQAVYGHQWTAFRSATYQDASGTGAVTVDQVVGAFPAGAQADAAFRALVSGLAQCPSTTTTDPSGQSTTWTYTVYPPGQGAVVWTATENNGSGWACYHQAREADTALIEVGVCEAGNGQPAVSGLADALAGQVTR
jgi:hypothetical protein